MAGTFLLPSDGRRSSSREPVSGPACCGCAGVLEHVPEEVDGDVQVFLQDDGEVRILMRLKSEIRKLLI